MSEIVMSFNGIRKTYRKNKGKKTVAKTETWIDCGDFGDFGVQ